METKKAFNSMYLCLVVCVLLGSICGFAESVYVVDHGWGIYSFDVVNNQLLFRHQLLLTNRQSAGGIDVAIDEASGTLFRTDEYLTGIDLLDAQTLTFIKTCNLPVHPDTAIVYDAANSRLLCTQRNSNQLFILLWDPIHQTLTYQTPAVYLSQIQYACDLAIHGDILYVSEYHYGGTPTYSEVCMYDMSDDFAYLGKVNMQYPVVSIDYNAADDSLYGGSWKNDYLTKRTFDPNELTVKQNLDFNLVGIAANPRVSGRLFATTVDDSYNSAIRLFNADGYDPDDFEILDTYSDNEPNGPSLGGLAGIVFSKDFIESVISLETYDDTSECVSVGGEITYTIEWDNTSAQTFTNVRLIDALPAGVDYPQGGWTLDPNGLPVAPDPAYDPNTHSYIWEIGTLAPDDSGSVELTVQVNSKAEPGMPLHNVVGMWSDDVLFGWDTDTEDADICCWDTTDPNIIYVDEHAAGNNTGVDWANAYTNLQGALARAGESGCEESFTIYVAQGTYIPGYTADDSFVLPDAVSLYGGFPFGGCEFGDRKPKKYKTILSGYIDETSRHEMVVVMGDNSLLDGFIITEASDYGIYGSGSDFTIEHCIVENNELYGIYVENGDLSIKWCNVQGNGRHGIEHRGTGYWLNIENCRIAKNDWHGIRCQDSTPTIKSSVITQNGFEYPGYYGINITWPTESPVLYNNTIVLNASEGIFFTDNGTISDPNASDWPDIQNCILWYNNDGGEQLAGYEFTQYSCVYDPNDSNGENYSLYGSGNFSGKPGFAYPIDPNNLPETMNPHLAWDSPCKDKGNPSHDSGDVGLYDMDYGDRIVNSRVEIGADEIDCEDVSNPLDWNADGLVNLVEFSKFSAAWLGHDPNDPAWLADPNLADPDLSEGWYAWKYVCNLDDTYDSEYVIDVADFLVFCESWLWTACWKQNQFEMYGTYSMMSGGGEEMLMVESVIPVQAGIQQVEKKSIEEQILDLENAVEFLEQIWMENDGIQQEIDAETWQKFMDSVKQSLTDLKSENSPAEN